MVCYVGRVFLFGKEVHLYPFLESTSKRYHIRVFLCLTYVTLYDHLYFLPCCWTWHDVTHFTAERYCCVCVPQSPVLTHVGFIHVLALIHSAAMNIAAHVSFKIVVPLGLCPGMGLLGLMALLCLLFHERLSCSHLWIYWRSFPPTGGRVLFLHSLSSIFYTGHSDVYEVTPLLIHSFLILIHAEYLFMCFMAISMSPLEKVPFKYYASIWWVASLISRCISCLYVWERNSSWVSLFAHVSSTMRFVFLFCLWFPLLCQHFLKINLFILIGG